MRKFPQVLARLRHLGFIEGLEGIEYLRAAVQWLDNRNECENEEKTPNQLLGEYRAELEHDCLLDSIFGV